MTYCIVFISKSDEKTEAESLGFILPSHEYFHQSMVIADCESELVRDGSRGLEGGAFFEATILNRKEAKVGKGKDAIDPIKDFLQIKSDARFCQYFVKKYDLDLDNDNSPEHLRSASDEVKKAYLHTKVQEVLRDLLPQFRNSSFEDPQLLDHPLEGGRRPKYQPARENTRKETILEPPLRLDRKFWREHLSSFRTLCQTVMLSSRTSRYCPLSCLALGRQSSSAARSVLTKADTDWFASLMWEDALFLISKAPDSLMILPKPASILRPASVIKLWKNLRKKMIRLMMLSITTRMPSSFWMQFLVSIVCLKSMATA